MRHCDESVSPRCPGHSGPRKYADCLIEALFAETPDDSTGDVDGFGRWIGLVIVTKPQTLKSLDIPVTVPAHTYGLLLTDEYGFTDFQRYVFASDAQDAFDSWNEQYGQYLDAQDAREAYVVSSTGRIGR